MPVITLCCFGIGHLSCQVVVFTADVLYEANPRLNLCMCVWELWWAGVSVWVRMYVWGWMCTSLQSIYSINVVKAHCYALQCR